MLRAVTGIAICLAAAGVMPADVFSQAANPPGSKSRSDAEQLVNDVLRQGSNQSLQDIVREMSKAAEKSKPPALPLDDAAGVDLGHIMKEASKMSGATGMSGERLMVFVSLSMPEKSLTDLAKETAKAGGVFILRGMVNGKMPDTLKALMPLSQTGIRVAMDPTLYQTYGVVAAPTFVLATRETAPCETQSCDRPVPSHDKVSGNVPLKVALEHIDQANGSAASVAREYLKRMEP